MGPAAGVLQDLRARLARLERGKPGRRGAVLPLGLLPIDEHLPDGGLARGGLHEVFGGDADVEHGGAVALLIAGLLASTGGKRPGKVLWVLERRDLFAPALAGVGLHPDRTIFAEAGKPAAVLAVMEEGLREPGLAAVVGELRGRLTLTASRRLQLAAEISGVIGFVLRRSRRHQDPMLIEPSAALTRWRVSALPSLPPVPEVPATPGLGRPRWLLELLRCRGAEPAIWTVEGCDAQGRLRLATDLADRSAASRPRIAATRPASGDRAA